MRAKKEIQFNSNINQDRFGDYYEKKFSKFANMARKRFGLNLSDAEEVAQLALMDLAGTDPSSVTTKGKDYFPDSFAISILYRKGLSYLRSERKYIDLGDQDSLRRPELSKGIRWLEKEVGNNMDARALLKLIANPTTRQIIEMRMNDIDYEVIADILGITKNYAMKTYSETIKSLRKSYMENK